MYRQTREMKKKQKTKKPLNAKKDASSIFMFLSLVQFELMRRMPNTLKFVSSYRFFEYIENVERKKKRIIPFLMLFNSKTTVKIHKYNATHIYKHVYMYKNALRFG